MSRRLVVAGDKIFGGDRDPTYVSNFIVNQMVAVFQRQIGETDAIIAAEREARYKTAGL
jgi:hypothetical protein